MDKGIQKFKQWKIVERGCIAALIIALLSIIPLFPGHCGDMYCWRTWSTNLFRHGITKAYIGSGSDYLPLYQYFLLHFGRMMGSAAYISWFITYLKVYTLIFEIWGLYLVYCWLDKKQSFLAILLCAILNIAYLYDTMVWGQVDAIISALSFAGIYFAWKNKLMLSSAMIVLALNMKLLVLPFLPVWGILMLMSLWNGGDAKRRAWRIILWMAAIETAILIPFGWKATKAVINLLLHLSGEYPKISVSAFNIYYLLLGQRATEMDDTVLVGGMISYKNLGSLLFFTGGFIALIPVLRLALNAYRRKISLQMPREIVWLTCALVSLLFFYLPTEIHERYAHPALIFLLTYTLYARKPGPFILVSIAFFLNLEAVLSAYDVYKPSLFLLYGRISATLYLVSIAWLYQLLFKYSIKGLEILPITTIIPFRHLFLACLLYIVCHGCQINYHGYRAGRRLEGAAS